MGGGPTGGDGQQRQSPRGDARVVAVRRHADPDGQRGECDEWCGPPCELLVAEGPDRHEYGGRRAGPHHDAEGARPPGSTESQPVEAEEGQQCPRWVAGDRDVPGGRGVDGDVHGESLDQRVDAAVAWELGQVAAGAVHPADPSADHAVDQGQRHGPGGGHEPGRDHEDTPGQATGDRRSPGHDGEGEDDGADRGPVPVGEPDTQDRRRSCEGMFLLRVLGDQRSEPRQVEVGHDEGDGDDGADDARPHQVGPVAVDPGCRAGGSGPRIPWRSVRVALHAGTVPAVPWETESR